MNNYLKASLDAFNASKNCDRSSVKSFYNSYVERKNKIVAGKIQAWEDGKPINRKKLNWEVACLEEVQKNEEEVLIYIEKLLRNSSIYESFDKNLIDKAKNLIGDSNGK